MSDTKREALRAQIAQRSRELQEDMSAGIRHLHADELRDHLAKVGGHCPVCGSGPHAPQPPQSES